MIANEKRRSNSGSVVAWLLSEALVVDVVKKMAARKTCVICGTNLLIMTTCLVKINPILIQVSLLDIIEMFSFIDDISITLHLPTYHGETILMYFHC